MRVLSHRALGLHLAEGGRRLGRDGRLSCSLGDCRFGGGQLFVDLVDGYLLQHLSYTPTLTAGLSLQRSLLSTRRSLSTRRRIDSAAPPSEIDTTCAMMHARAIMDHAHPTLRGIPHGQCNPLVPRSLLITLGPMRVTC